MMAKKAKDKSIQQWLIPHLRNISRMWPQKQIALDRSKIRVAIGKFKNGNTEYRTKFKCAGCEDIFDRDEVQVDHIEPMIDPKVGFVDWNNIIDRLFCDSNGLQVLCRCCHISKSNVENSERKKK